MMLIFTDDTGRVTHVHAFPELLTRSQRDAATLEVDTLPARPETAETSRPVLRVHDGQVLWTVEPTPPTRSQRQQAVEATSRLVAQMVVAGTLDTETLAQVQAAFQPWEPWEDVEVGDVRLWADALVECIQAHTTQPDWTPDVTPALWKVHRTDTGGPIEWQPGLELTVEDQVTYDGVTYNVIQAHTTQEGWEPPNTPALFEPV